MTFPIIYLVLTIFFALNYTIDGMHIEKSKGRKTFILMIVLGFVANAVIWPLRLMRALWVFFHVKILKSK